MADIDVSLDEIIRRKKHVGNRFKPPMVRKTNQGGNFEVQRKFSNNSKVDARMKIISKQRAQMHDARDRLNMIAKKTDARQRLMRMKAIRQNRQQTKVAPALMRKVISGPMNFLRSSSRVNLTRTIRSAAFNEPMEDSNRIVSSNGRITLHSDQRNKTLFDMDYDSHLFNPIEKVAAKSMMHSTLPSSLSIKSRLSENINTLQGYRVVISNLHDDVSQDDIIELFGEIGPLAHASLIRQGAAEVIFHDRSHALKACETYHNRQLDRKPMCVKLVSATTIQTDLHEGIGISRAESLKSRRKVSPDVDIVRHALFHRGLSSTISHQPSFSVTMAKK